MCLLEFKEFKGLCVPHMLTVKCKKSKNKSWNLNFFSKFFEIKLRAIAHCDNLSDRTFFVPSKGRISEQNVRCETSRSNWNFRCIIYNAYRNAFRVRPLPSGFPICCGAYEVRTMNDDELRIHWLIWKEWDSFGTTHQSCSCFAVLGSA